MKPKLLILIAAVLWLAAPLAHGAIYIKFDGVDGDVTAQGYERHIEVLSWSFTVSNPGGFSNATLDHVSCSAPMSKATPKLLEAVAKGKVFAQVVLHVLRENNAGRVTYYKYELKNVMLSSYRVEGLTLTGAVSDATVPLESYSLNFEEVKVTCVSEDGTSVTGQAQFPAR